MFVAGSHGKKMEERERWRGRRRKRTIPARIHISGARGGDDVGI
jgi:hypothetical protein